MKVYDFDNTIYDGDSTVDFVTWCLGTYPKTRKYFFPICFACAGLGLHILSKDSFKAKLYRFLGDVPDTEKAAADFWEGHRKNIQKWYLDQKEPGDLIISASPEFLLRPVAEELGVSLIASPVDKDTGKLLGPNNSNEVKVKRFTEKYGDGMDAGASMADLIEEFYSDSDDDLPMARLAAKAYKVKKGAVRPWTGIQRKRR